MDRPIEEPFSNFDMSTKLIFLPLLIEIKHGILHAQPEDHNKSIFILCKSIRPLSKYSKNVKSFEFSHILSLMVLLTQILKENILRWLIGEIDREG